MFHSFCRNKAIKAIGTKFHFVWLFCCGWAPKDLQRVITSWNKYKDLKIIISDLKKDELTLFGFQEKFITKSYSMKGPLRGSTCHRRVNLHIIEIDSVDEDVKNAQEDMSIEKDGEKSTDDEEDMSIEKDGEKIIDDEDIIAHLDKDVSSDSLRERLVGVEIVSDEEKSSRKERKRIGNSTENDKKGNISTKTNDASTNKGDDDDENDKKRMRTTTSSKRNRTTSKRKKSTNKGDNVDDEEELFNKVMMCKDNFKKRVYEELYEEFLISKKRQAAGRSSSSTSIITENVVLLYVEALSLVDRQILIDKLMQTCTNPGSSEVKGDIVKTSVITTSNNFFNTSASVSI